MDKALFKKTAIAGIVTNNPIFVLVLGMCPTLALSTTLDSALWLGLATLFVLVCSNVIISLVRRLIPDKVRIPFYILVIATFVSITDMLLGRFLPSELYSTIAIGIKLIVVNCVILARAEAFASNNKVGYSALDGVSMGIGFLAAILLLAAFRYLLWSVFKIAVFQETAGGFLALAILMALFNFVNTLVKRYTKPQAATAKEV